MDHAADGATDAHLCDGAALRPIEERMVLLLLLLPSQHSLMDHRLSAVRVRLGRTASSAK